MPNIIEITDFFAPELDVYARLTEVQLLNREFPEKGMFIAESPKVIERALDAGYEPVSVLVEKKHIHKIDDKDHEQPKRNNARQQYFNRFLRYAGDCLFRHEVHPASRNRAGHRVRPVRNMAYKQ